MNVTKTGGMIDVFQFNDLFRCRGTPFSTFYPIVRGMSDGTQRRIVLTRANCGSIACWMAELNDAFCLVIKAKNTNYLISSSGNRTHNLSPLIMYLNYTKLVIPYIIFILFVYISISKALALQVFRRSISDSHEYIKKNETGLSKRVIFLSFYRQIVEVNYFPRHRTYYPRHDILHGDCAQASPNIANWLLRIGFF